VLCERVQEEWNKWTVPYRSTALSAAAAGDEFASPSAGGGEDGGWNEIGKGSRPIRVTSNLSFSHTPLSRLFCGRVRTQLSVANRATDTMSFQPFWALHLDIDDPATQAQEPPLSAQARHRRKTPHMSVAKALERYMHPSEISGYRKKGTPAPSPSSYGYGYEQQAATTRALHMHALDSHSLPKILVLHLKRFEQHADHFGGFGFGAQRAGLSKIGKHVQFHRRLHLPPSYLGTAASALGGADAAAGVGAGVEYELRAVVVHHGASMAGGHYTAFVRDEAAEAELNRQQQREVQKQQREQTGPPSSASTGKTAQKKQSAPAQAPKGKQGKKTGAGAKPMQQLLLSSSDEDEDDEADNGRNGSASDAPVNEVWLHCDDARVSPVPTHTVYAQQAYLLFYTIVEEQQQRAAQAQAHNRR